MLVRDLYNRLDRFIGRLSPPGEAALGFIDYAHRVGDVLYHGTLSNLDGEVRATWTYEENGEPVTCNRRLDQDTFAWLCAALGNLAIFRESLCNDQMEVIDPVTHHVISLVFTENGAYGRCVCLVPASNTDEQFRVWLERLNRPDNPA
jgi:hypothetical protein